MKAARIIVAVLSLFVTAPIWYYLLYRVLDAVQATPVMWLLYWVYLPVALLCGLIAKLLDLAARRQMAAGKALREALDVYDRAAVAEPGGRGEGT